MVLLLDYSGSMEQVVDNKPKIQILKEQISGVIETASPKNSMTALIFGSNPKEGCRDISSFDGSPKEIKNRLISLKPGTFGKTPLSLGIRQFGKTILANNVKSGFILTDGSDSCGLDPCKAFLEIDNNLKKQSKKVNLLLIAFDAKTSKGALQCLDNIKLKNFNLLKVDVDDTAGLNDALKKMQQQDLGLTAENGTSIDPDSMAWNYKQGTSSSVVETSNKKLGQPRETPEKDSLSFLEITGAPINAAFQATSEAESRTWHGNYILQTTPGDYEIRFIDPFGISKHLQLSAKEHVKLPWASLMVNANTNLNFSGRLVEFILNPTDETKEIHGKMNNINLAVDLEDGDREKSVQVPFGEYEIKVASPEWLKEKVMTKKIRFERGNEMTVNFLILFKDEIKIVENPLHKDFSVLEIKLKEVEERYLLFPGQKRIPIPLNAKSEFLKK